MGVRRTKRSHAADDELIPLTNDDLSDALWCVSEEDGVLWFAPRRAEDQWRRLKEAASSPWGSPLAPAYNRSMRMWPLLTPQKAEKVLRAGKPLDRLLLAMSRAGFVSKHTELTLSIAALGHMPGQRPGVQDTRHIPALRAQVLVWDDPLTTVLRPATTADLAPYGTERTLHLGHPQPHITEVSCHVLVPDAKLAPDQALLVLPTTSSGWFERPTSPLYLDPHTKLDGLVAVSRQLSKGGWRRRGSRADVMQDMCAEAGIHAVDTLLAQMRCTGDVQFMHDYSSNPRAQRLLTIMATSTSRWTQTEWRPATVVDKLVPLRRTLPPAAQPTLIVRLLTENMAVHGPRSTSAWYEPKQVFGVQVQETGFNLFNPDDFNQSEADLAAEWLRLGFFDEYLELNARLPAGA